MPSSDYYEPGAPQLKAYLKLMVEIAMLLGAPEELAQRDMNDTLMFEMRLANMTISSEERRNYSATYNKITLSELQVTVPSINWTSYFDIVMPLVLNDTEEIVFKAPQ